MQSFAFTSFRFFGAVPGEPEEHFLKGRGAASHFKEKPAVLKDAFADFPAKVSPVFCFDLEVEAGELGKAESCLWGYVRPGV